MINIVCGNTRPDSGTVLWNNIDARKGSSKFSASLGYVPQTIAMYPEFTGKEYLYYLGSLKEIPADSTSGEVRRVLNTVGLYDDRNYRIKTLSEGMKRRLLIAQALLGDPDLLIMDEPTAGLDPGQRIAFKKMISELSQDKIIILSTHIVPDVENLPCRILFLKNGTITLIDDTVYNKDGKEITTPLEKLYNRFYEINE